MHPYFFQTTQTWAKFRDNHNTPTEHKENNHNVQSTKDFLSHRTEQTQAGSISYHNLAISHNQSIKKFPDRPISYLGSLKALSLPLLAIVGPRQADAYAYKGVKRVLDHAKTYTLGTISGLAEGVDTACAIGSIDQGIPTTAILGGGLYRGWHDARIGPLMRRIIDNGGCILSEYPLQMKPTPYTFPQRNRLIVAFSQAVFVPYAGIKSGTMLSLGYARDYDKPVYTLPTPFDFEPGNGSNLLVQQHHITAVVDADYFLAKHFSSVQKEPPGPSKNNKPTSIPHLSDPHQAAILTYLKHHGTSDNAILARNCCAGDFGACLTALTMLEIEGHIYQPRPGVYTHT
ncbi:MAG: DNA-protecting protein DprA [Candidatus Absconditabacterales bacterium]|nr:DNA-protecting protein DprA [Candidatus Absconditabacterales bacterium]